MVGYNTIEIWPSMANDFIFAHHFVNNWVY